MGPSERVVLRCWPNQPISSRAGQSATLAVRVRAPRQELRRAAPIGSRCVTRGPGRARRTRPTRCPRGRGRPVPRRVAPDREVGSRWRRMPRGRRHVPVPIAGVDRRHDGPIVGLGDGLRRRSGSLTLAPGVRGLASRPVLEGGADRKGTREAVRLLVGARAWRGNQLRVAAVAVIGTCGAGFAVVLERHERTRGGAVHAGEPSLGHRGDDTRPRVSPGQLDAWVTP